MTKKAKIQKKGRVCKYGGCKHVLSIYNPEILCYVHQQAEPQVSHIRAAHA
jgi:hypothetical protein